MRAVTGYAAHSRHEQLWPIEQRMVELQDDLAVVRAKIETYRGLIARGLDCEDEIEDDVVDQLRVDALLAGTLPGTLPQR